MRSTHPFGNATNFRDIYVDQIAGIGTFATQTVASGARTSSPVNVSQSRRHATW